MEAIPLLNYCWRLHYQDHGGKPFDNLSCQIPLKAQTYSPKEIIDFLPGVFRYFTQSYIYESLIKKKETPFDFIYRSGVTDPRRKGPPLGGIGK